MVTKLHKDAVKGEIASLRAMLEGSAARDKLGSISLRQRLQNLEEQLTLMEGQARNVANVALIFDGGAVRGSSAIDADFAGRALQEYQELITKQMADADLGGLAQRGPLPIKQQQQARLNITDIVHGSFGFVLEEDNSEQYQIFESPTMIAVSKVTDILTGLSSADSYWFDQSLPELDARVFQTLKRFVTLLRRHDSTLRISEEKREFSLDQVSVYRAYERLSQTDVDEIDEEVVGELLGIAPIQRRFDLRSLDNNEILSGAVAYSLSADYLERIERDEMVAGRSWRALIRTKTVQRAEGRRPTISRTLIDLFPVESVELRNKG